MLPSTHNCTCPHALWACPAAQDTVWFPAPLCAPTSLHVGSLRPYSRRPVQPEVQHLCPAAQPTRWLPQPGATWYRVPGDWRLLCAECVEQPADGRALHPILPGQHHQAAVSGGVYRWWLAGQGGCTQKHPLRLHGRHPKCVRGLALGGRGCQPHLPPATSGYPHRATPSHVLCCPAMRG